MTASGGTNKVADESSQRRALQRRLLAALGTAHRARNPQIDVLVRAANGTPGGRPNWDEVLGAPIQPYTALLTALHDLDRGLDALAFGVERATRTSDPREWEFITQIAAVVYVAVLDRLDDMVKRFSRAKLVSPERAGVIESAVSELRAGTDFLHKVRHQTAHSVQGHSLALSRIPESTRTWDVFALLAIDADLLDVRSEPPMDDRVVAESMSERFDELVLLVESACSLICSSRWDT